MSHVFDHLNNSLAKRFQGVFDGSPSDVVSLVDDAYEKALNSGIVGTVGSNGNLVREIPMDRVIGWEGGTRGSGEALSTLKLVTKEENGIVYVITAFPVR